MAKKEKEIEAGKVRLLMILDLLMETDENHPLRQNEICQKLQIKEIEADRKTVSRDILALKNYYEDYCDTGYNIVLSSENGNRGYYMSGRRFEDWEIKVLIDAVWQAGFLTEERSKKLSENLMTLTGEKSKEILMKLIPQTVVPEKYFIKTKNEEVEKNIEMLMLAISKGQKVKFQYVHTDINLKRHIHDDGKEYLINPYSLKWRDNRYYLICNYDKYDGPAFYRLDRIINLRITDEPVKPAEAVFGENPTWQIEKFVEKSLHNFVAERKNSTAVTLSVKPDMVDDLVDYFGEDILFRGKGAGDEYEYRVKVNEGDGLYFWLLQYGENVTVVSPLRIRDELLKRIDQIRSKYSKERC